MPHTKIIFPSEIMGSFDIPVRISDINYGNHVGNDSFISIVHEARLQWLRSHNHSELNIEGTGLIMSSLAIDFKAEGFYGDILKVEIASGDMSEIRFELLYKISVKRNDQVMILAIASTTMVSYDYANKKKIAIPEALNLVLNKSKL